MSARWNDEHIIAESEALAAHYGLWDTDMSQEVEKTLRKMRSDLLAQLAIPPAIYQTLKYALHEMAELDGNTPSCQAAKDWLKARGRGNGG